MGGFRRFCLGIYALAGLCALAALGLTAFGPWTAEAADLLRRDWYRYTVVALSAILTLGLVVSLLRALLSHRERAIVVCEVDGDQVSVTRDAIASQAAHIVAADGSCTADDVFVTVGKRGVVDVVVKVLPRTTMDVRRKGPRLHGALVRELEALCGDSLGSVSIEFLEAQQPSSVAAHEDEGEPAPRQGSEITYVPRPSGSTDAAPADDLPSDDAAEGDDRA